MKQTPRSLIHLISAKRSSIADCGSQWAPREGGAARLPPECDDSLSLVKRRLQLDSEWEHERTDSATGGFFCPERALTSFRVRFGPSPRPPP